MPREERPWERRYTPDGEVSRSAARAIGLAFSLVVIISMVVFGWDMRGLLVGIVLGIAVIVGLSKLIVRNQRPTKRSPPRDLL